MQAAMSTAGACMRTCGDRACCSLVLVHAHSSGNGSAGVYSR
jgi:hypothetical protein